MNIDDILSHRERKSEIIQSYLAGRAKRKAVIIIKANIPGEDKNIKEAYVLVRLFKNELLPKLNPNDTYFDEGPDGPMFLMAFKQGEAIDYKKEMMLVEENHALGRFVDLDVYVANESSISRLTLKQKPRSCYVCDQPASVCARMKTHPNFELIAYVKKHIKAYILEVIEQLMDEAIMTELNLEDKFGLVTKTSMGSHPDMDYKVMIQAKKAIMPYLISMFDQGYRARDLTKLLNDTRHIGIEAETKMMRATSGINAYKGLIFVLGVFALASGYTIANNEEIGLTFYHAKVICHNILKDFERPLSTYGYNAYVNHHIFGVRGEAHQGFPAVRNTMMLVQGRKLSDELLRNVLKDLILMTDDTVLLKRAGSIGNYFRIKEMVKAINMQDLEDIRRFTKYAIRHDLSFGGSADLLIAVVYMKLLQDTFY